MICRKLKTVILRENLQIEDANEVYTGCIKSKQIKFKIRLDQAYSDCITQGEFSL